MRRSGVTGGEIDIRPAAEQLLKDIGHAASRGEKQYDVTYEMQAGLRTDYLFRLANHNARWSSVTGDLSELALGWCTYGVGDHMSHYNPNARCRRRCPALIRFVGGSADFDAKTTRILEDILATENLARAGARR